MDAVNASIVNQNNIPDDVFACVRSFKFKMTIVTFNNLSKADGSALIDQNNTIVQATVFGPVDLAQSKINYEEAIVQILYKPKVSIPSSSPAFDYVRGVEELLKSVFQEVILTRLHPRTSISILVQEIYNGGSLMSATINAVCCALLDAGVPLKCPVVGVSRQIDNCKFDFVFDKELDLITVLTRGRIDEESLNEAMEKGREEAKESFRIIREKIKERFTL